MHWSLLRRIGLATAVVVSSGSGHYVWVCRLALLIVIDCLAAWPRLAYISVTIAQYPHACITAAAKVPGCSYKVDTRLLHPSPGYHTDSKYDGIQFVKLHC